MRLIVALLLVMTPAVSASQRPNILFILVDDMGYHDLGCFGGERAKTPNIDRLAAEGIRFTQFYVNAPICSPSRVAVTTGQYPARWRITSYLDSRGADQRRGIADWLDPKAPSLARMLRDNGYYTAHVGKWHMGGQRDVGDAPPITEYGFDRSLTNFEGLGERLLPKFASGLKHQPTLMSAQLGGDITWVERHKVTEKFVDRAIEEMKAAHQQGKPFYINFWTDDVHSPCEAPPDARGDGSPAVQYVGVLNELDRQFGRAFDFIRSQPHLRDNTLILLASDNGPETGLGSSAPLRGSKGQLYEGGIKSPLVAWWPGGLAKAQAGAANERTVLAGFDLPPTLLALAGIGYPKGVSFDGVDMSRAIIGEDSSPRRTPIMWVRPPDRPGPANDWPDLAIREGDWKLLIFRDGSRPQLFDLGSDPNEEKNVAVDYPAVAANLRTQLLHWDKSTAR